MMAYATITTGRSLELLYGSGWGVFLTPDALARNRPAFRWSQAQDPPMTYALDNGAWGAFTRQEAWDSGKFVELLAELGHGARFAAIPDIVEGGADSLALSLEWAPRVLEHTQLGLIPVQDGMIVADIEPHLSERVGVFVGGSTGFKEDTLGMWAALAKRSGTYCHVGRVNSVRRTYKCINSLVDSIDGTSVTRFSSTLTRLDGARRQMSLMEVLGE